MRILTLYVENMSNIIKSDKILCRLERAKVLDKLGIKYNLKDLLKMKDKRFIHFLTQ